MIIESNTPEQRQIVLEWLTDQALSNRALIGQLKKLDDKHPMINELERNAEAQERIALQIRSTESQIV